MIKMTASKKPLEWIRWTAALLLCSCAFILNDASYRGYAQNEKMISKPIWAATWGVLLGIASLKYLTVRRMMIATLIVAFVLRVTLTD